MISGSTSSFWTIGGGLTAYIWLPFNDDYESEIGTSVANV